MYDQITASLFKQMVLHGAACITREKQAINDLNVFPVPDGDTGTNMSMTLAAAVTELQRKEPETVDQAASITASALLRGARGNSGVILSLLFRGISKGLKGHESAAPAAFAAALQEGVSSAYKAVMKPTEGTILTVSRLAAKRAVEAAAEGESAATEWKRHEHLKNVGARLPCPATVLRVPEAGLLLLAYHDRTAM